MAVIHSGALSRPISGSALRRHCYDQKAYQRGARARRRWLGARELTRGGTPLGLTRSRHTGRARVRFFFREIERRNGADTVGRSRVRFTGETLKQSPSPPWHPHTCLLGKGGGSGSETDGSGETPVVAVNYGPSHSRTSPHAAATWS